MNPEQVQIQTGNHNRSAARDYLETHQHFDEKCCLLHASSEEKDRLAINDEGYFKKRFGFDAPLEQRNAVVKIKSKFDFTDKEIKHLKYSGLLIARKGLPTSICACRCVYFFGVGYLFLTLILIVIPAAISVIQAPNQSAFIVRFLGFIFVFSVLLSFSMLSSIEPINILRNKKFKIGDKFIIQ